MGGSREAVGRVTGALLRAAGKTTHPPPLPLREGAVPTLRPPVGGNEKVQAEGGSEEQDRASGWPPSLQLKEHIMAFVRVEQRNARLAAGGQARCRPGQGRPVSKGTCVAISQHPRRDGGEEEATAIQWTLWGKQAENAAEYLGKGSHVNIVGRVRNNNYENADKAKVYGLTFTCEEIDYLDSRAEAEARRAKEGGRGAGQGRGERCLEQGRTVGARKPAKATQPARDDDVPF